MLASYPVEAQMKAGMLYIVCRGSISSPARYPISALAQLAGRCGHSLRQSRRAHPDREVLRGKTSSLSAPLRACMPNRSEEHTSDLQSLMRISYAVFCLKKTPTAPHLRSPPTKPIPTHYHRNITPYHTHPTTP